MAEQLLQGDQVNAGLEEMGGVTVTQGVHARLLGDARGADGPLTATLDAGDVQGGLGGASGEEEALGLVFAPIASEAVEQVGGEGNEAVLAALGAADVQLHALGIDVFDAETDDLADAQAAGIGEMEQQPVARGEGGGEEADDLFATEDGGQSRDQPLRHIR